MSSMKGGLGNLLKQAQQVQAKMQEAQEQLANEIVKGESGGGMVQVNMNCRHDVKSVSIDPSLLTEDKEILEDLITAAFNDATRKVEERSRERLTSITSGLQMPAGFGDLMGDGNK